MVGKAEYKDQFLSEVNSNPNFDQTFKSDDDCICFQGWHLQSGVSYHTCYCNCDITLHAGYEYTLWVNAPTYKSYELGANGQSVNNERNLSLQGFFVGADFKF